MGTDRVPRGSSRSVGLTLSALIRAWSVTRRASRRTSRWSVLHSRCSRRVPGRRRVRARAPSPGHAPTAAPHQRGTSAGLVDRPDGFPGEGEELVDEHEEVCLVVLDPAGEQNFVRRADHGRPVGHLPPSAPTQPISIPELMPPAVTIWRGAPSTVRAKWSSAATYGTSGPGLPVRPNPRGSIRRRAQPGRRGARALLAG